MSVDLYVSTAADDWPSIEQVQQCLNKQGHPLVVERFPSLKATETVTEGVSARLENDSDAYLEGELFTAISGEDTVFEMNKRLQPSGLKIEEGDAVMSIRTRSTAEMCAASYLISSIITCFDGVGFEPQGNTAGKSDFSETLLLGAARLEGFTE